MRYVLLISFLAAMGGVACTTTAWMVDEEPAPDPDSKQILSVNRIFHSVGEPAPQNPVLMLELVNVRELHYNRHLVSRRYIQQYRPRYGYLALGLAGLGAGLYLANSPSFGGDLSGREQAILNLSALGIGSAAFISMKPEGEPRPAGEYRLLEKTGTQTRIDTIQAPLPVDANALLGITRGDDTLVRDRTVPLTGNRFGIHLVRETGLSYLEEDDTTGFHVNLQYQYTTYEQYIAIDAIMQEFVEVTAPASPIRSSPANLSNNIIRHAEDGSRFPFIRELDDYWYQVLRQDGTAYINKAHARKIWQTSDHEDIEDLVVHTGPPVFGDEPIERDLPDNRRMNPDGIAIIIANGRYQEPVAGLPNASRTAELAELYANRVLGYYSDNIIVFENMTHSGLENLLEESDSLYIGGRHLSMDESDLFIYYYGHAFTDQDNRLCLLPVDYDPSALNERVIPLDDFVQTISNIRSGNTVLVLDTDWSRGTVFGLTDDLRSIAAPAGGLNLVRLFSESGLEGTVFWAAQPGQQAQTYRAANGRGGHPYDIFSWYFFKALHENARTTGDIESYLERNVPFTSRRLHDRAQDPGFWGDRELPLTAGRD